ncbi:DNA-binding protein [Alkalihalobacillus oceani]|uniref:DNA-binding protein n=1 Tax=Halalkalibacter oceani TaxID=1653776 RepID=A0A9X2DS86_9BACI|nr:DNA-binding protein [Halalkalibacter oceani]MCM3715756.1 DNA-binding protein [Halalkalibacter oceani]
MISLAIGIAAAGYFIGEGLKNFHNPQAEGLLDSAEDEYELIREKDVHDFLNISKEDARSLTVEHPDIPHVVLNGTIYYPKHKLREWVMQLGES